MPDGGRDQKGAAWLKFPLPTIKSRLNAGCPDPCVNPEETPDSPIRLLAKQISGNAIRPRMPEPKVIEQELAPQHAIRPQQNIITDEVDHVVPRIHTISSKIYEDEDPEGAL